MEAVGSSPLAAEQLALRHHEVDPGRLHGVDGADGARELALKGTDKVDVLHEVGGAERVRLVEQLVADGPAGRQGRPGA
jgi:hypothetical protein